MFITSGLPLVYMLYGAKLISMDQHIYILNNNICFNTQQIQAIADYADLFEIDGVILFLDFKKAFDTGEHEFMLNTLQKIGFGDSSMKWIKHFI